MFPRLFVSGVCGAGLVAAACAAGQGASAETDLHAIARPLLEAGYAEGIGIAIVSMRDDGVTGTAGVLGTPRTSPEGFPVDGAYFEIGSITKAFTGILLAHEVVSGRLSLDQPFVTLLPEGVEGPSDERARGITLGQLASHTSGLSRLPSNIAPADSSNPYSDYTCALLWNEVKSLRTQSPPGTRFAYSNLGMGLLGTLLAHHNGMTFEELVRDRVFGPAGMERSTISLPEGAGTIIGHDVNGDVAGMWSLGCLEGAGAIRSTIGDMQVFAAVVLDALMSDDGGETGAGVDARSTLARAIRLAATPVHRLPDGSASGLGWQVSGEGWVWHNGQTGGYHSHLAVDPACGNGVCILADSASGEVDDVARAMMRSLAGEDAGEDIVRPVADFGRDYLERLVGRYVAPGFYIDVLLRGDGRLFTQAMNQPAFRMYAAAADRFFLRIVDAELVFELPGDGGPAAAMTLHQAGNVLKLMRDVATDDQR